MSRDVYVYHSDMPGIPQLVAGGVAGGFANLLYACCVTGFGDVVLDSLTHTGGVATATASGGVNLFDGTMGLPHSIVISGSTNGWDGEYVLNADPGLTSCTFQVPVGLASPATGTITMKRAGAGMSRLFSSGNKEVYRFKDTGTMPGYLMVDDSNAEYAKVRLAESAAATVDYATMTGLCPTVAQHPTGLFWMKNSANKTPNKKFILVVWKGGLLFAVQFNGSYPNTYELCYAGACLSRKAGDAFPGIVIGAQTIPYAPNSTQDFADISGNFDAGQYLQRSANQVGSSLKFVKYGPRFMNRIGGDDNGFEFSCTVDGMDELQGPIHIVEGDVSSRDVRARRGVMPGLWCPFVNNNRNTFDVLSNMSKLPGRRVMLIRWGSSYARFIGVDIDGPYSLGDY